MLATDAFSITKTAVVWRRVPRCQTVLNGFSKWLDLWRQQLIAPDIAASQLELSVALVGLTA